MDRWRRVCLDAGLVRSSLARRFIGAFVLRLLLVSYWLALLPKMDYGWVVSNTKLYTLYGCRVSDNSTTG